jgi:small redox-active disulfide protein 2
MKAGSRARNQEKERNMKIEVLGTGCPKCMSMEQNVKKAIAELAVQAVVEKVTDIQQIIQRGVMSTPALVIDGTVVLQGKNPTVEQLKDLIRTR